MKTQDRNEMIEKIGQCASFILGSVDENGYPNAKAMMKVEHDGLETFYFSTYTSAIRTIQYMKNPKACIYCFAEKETVFGLMLKGEMEVLTDAAAKKRFWVEDWKIYYPQGPADPDYCILKFIAKSGIYNCGEKKLMFDICR